MKITNVRPLVMGTPWRNLTFVVVETDEGITGVGEVRLVQCDIEVTSDIWVDPPALAEFKISGFGYSDMGPGIKHLAEDPEVEAAILLTDGYIDIPAEAPPYRLAPTFKIFVSLSSGTKILRHRFRDERT